MSEETKEEVKPVEEPTEEKTEEKKQEKDEENQGEKDDEKKGDDAKQQSNEATAVTAPAPATTTTTTTKKNKDDEKGEDGFKELTAIKQREEFFNVFEKSPEFAELRKKMRNDMIESLKSLAPIKERVKAQSFFDILANATMGVTSRSTQTYESLGEALPPYVAGIERNIHGTLKSKGIEMNSTDVQHLLLDWVLQPFYSNLFMIGDDEKKDEALLEVYMNYAYSNEPAMQPWKNLTADDLAFFCMKFGDLNSQTSFLDKSQALLNVVSYISTSAKRNPEIMKSIPEDMSTDVLLEGLTFLVMRLKPRQICANIAFLLRFAPDSVIKGELGYCITTFAVVLQSLLQKSIKDEDLEKDWILFRRGKRCISEAEGRRLLAEFMEDCVVVDQADLESAAAAAESAAAAKKVQPKDEIDKGWVMM